MSFLARLFGSKTKYTRSSRQIIESATVSAIKSGVLATISGTGGYYIPPGYMSETGALGATKLHQALRQLRDEGAIVRAPYDGWGEKWVAKP